MGEKISYKGWEYEIFPDGYELWGKNGCHVTQHAPYDKLLIPNGTHEENAKAQIDDMTEPVQVGPTDEEILRADVDYMALMLDVDLPSQSEEEE